MRSLSLFNTGWTFGAGFSDEALTRRVTTEEVRLPHTAVELPFNYFDETTYQKPFTYQAIVANRAEFAGREVRLRFDGAMANAKVWVNGTEVAAHADGYTPFTARLTGLLKDGDNLITVRIDGAENPAIPPFGGVIDYLTYAGIYRDVWLEVTAPVYIERLKIETGDVLTDAKSVSVRCDLGNPQALPIQCMLNVRLKAADGSIIVEGHAPVKDASPTIAFTRLAGLQLWDIDSPVLYTAEVELTSPQGADRLAATFGFRSAAFTPDGFVLNGRHLKIRGLNRHQSFPYTGYAMGRAAQEADARLMKHQLKLNLVRTSHYPQSPWFLDECDRIGLLVFEEIPGWQHVGDKAWQAEAIRNVERMITRDWNHPSIILWGVRINESADYHDFYTETNRLARALDPTRQTGGVRYITESEFLEDVYTMNDFVQGSEEMPGANHPRRSLRPVSEVTGLKRPVPYMVTEFNGHMYPTKRQDQEQRQAEHVTRHLSILNAAYGDPQISGCIGWCFFDYNTHKDFGSGDRLCYHGIADMFREPKFAAYAYASQCEPSDEVILKPVTFWARGERNIGGILPLIVLTNCDEVELRYGAFSKRVGPARDLYPHLPHAPVVIDHRHFSPEEMGVWGMDWQHGAVIGYIQGKPVAEVTFAADPLPTTLQVAPDTLRLSAEAGDTTRVIIRALDQAGNILPFMEESVTITVTGPAKRIGPAVAPLRGGVTGFWLQTTGGAGEISVSVTCAQFPETRVTLSAE